METGTQQSSILMLTREHGDDASPQPAGILPSTDATDPPAGIRSTQHRLLVSASGLGNRFALRPHRCGDRDDRPGLRDSV